MIVVRSLSAASISTLNKGPFPMVLCATFPMDYHNAAAVWSFLFIRILLSLVQLDHSHQYGESSTPLLENSDVTLTNSIAAAL